MLSYFFDMDDLKSTKRVTFVYIETVSRSVRIWNNLFLWYHGLFQMENAHLAGRTQFTKHLRDL